MFGRILKQWFWDTYDHLGRLLLINILLFFVTAPVLFYGTAAVLALGRQEPLLTAVLFVLFLLIVAPVLGTVWFAGLLGFGEQVSREKDPPTAEMLRSIRRHGPRVFLVLCVATLVALVLVINVWFYFFSGRLSDSLQVVGYALGGICVWLLLIGAGYLIHLLPLAVRSRDPWRVLMKQSLYLLFKYPILTLTVLLFIASLLSLGIMLRMVGLILYGFILPALVMNSTRDVLVDVEGRSANAADDEDRPTSWREIRAAEDEEEEERLNKARYDRGWQDILRPWEM